MNWLIARVSRLQLKIIFTLYIRLTMELPCYILYLNNCIIMTKRFSLKSLSISSSWWPSCFCQNVYVQWSFQSLHTCRFGKGDKHFQDQLASTSQMLLKVMFILSLIQITIRTIPWCTLMFSSIHACFQIESLIWRSQQIWYTHASTYVFYATPYPAPAPTCSNSTKIIC